MASKPKSTSKAKPAKAKKAPKMKSLVAPALFDISSVTEFHKELIDYVTSKKSEIVCDMKKVERITSPALQLLLSLDKTLANDGRKLTLKGVTPTIEAVFQQAGLNHKLKEWV